MTPALETAAAALLIADLERRLSAAEAERDQLKAQLQNETEARAEACCMAEHAEQRATFAERRASWAEREVRRLGGDTRPWWRRWLGGAR